MQSLSDQKSTSGVTSKAKQFSTNQFSAKQLSKQNAFHLKPILLALQLALTGFSAIATTYAVAEPAVQSQAIVYKIPAGDLGAALNRYALQSGVLISFDAALVKNIKTQGLQGSYRLDDGFRQLLLNSGFQAKKNADGYVLEAATTEKENVSSSEQSLPEVAVNAHKSASTENTGSYTTNQTSSATKLNLSLRETPQSVSVITRQRMDDQVLLGVNDVLKQTTGVSVLQNGPDSTDGVQYYSRGFAIENYMLDGIPLSSSLSGFYQATDMAFYDRVEIVRGATGLATGVGTPSAAINLVRKKPTKEFQASLTGMAGSWDNFRGEADVSGSLSEDGRVRGRGIVVKQDSNSFIDRTSLTKDMLYGILEVDLTPTLLFTAGVEYQKYDSKAVARAGLPLYFSDGSKTNFSRSENASATWGYFNHETVSYFTSLEKQFENSWVAKARFNQRTTDYDVINGYAIAGSPNTDGTGLGMFVTQWDSKPKQINIDAYASGPFSLLGREHELVLGMTSSKISDSGPSYNWQVLSIANIFQWDGKTPSRPATPATGVYSNSTYETAAYATTRLKPTDDLSIILGGRASNWKQNDGDLHRKERGVVTPYAGIIYDVDKNWSIYTSYTNIFKPQNNRGVSGAYLDPIEGNAYEAGVKSEFFNQRLNFSAAVFQIEQDNFAQIISPTIPVQGYPNEDAYRAVQGTKSRGVEFEVNGQLQPDWQVSAGVSYSRAKDNEGERINSYVPSTQVKLFTSYRLHGDWNKLTVGGGATWQNEISDIAGPNSERFTQDSYAVVDLFTRYQFNSNVSASLNINNLFDKEYLSTPRSTYYGTPRNAMMAVKYQF